jgi:hypothetical protein
MVVVVVVVVEVVVVAAAVMYCSLKMFRYSLHLLNNRSLLVAVQEPDCGPLLIHTYTDTFIHIYIRTYIRTYILTQIHTYIHLLNKMQALLLLHVQYKCQDTEKQEIDHNQSSF